MKFIIILLMCGCTGKSFSQENKISALFFGFSFSKYDEFKMNEFLQLNAFPEIPLTSTGISVQIHHVPNTFGFTVQGGLEMGKNEINNLKTSTKMFDGKIGPTIGIINNNLFSSYFSPLYSYTFYNTRHQVDYDSATSPSFLQVFSGNIIESNRYSHSVGISILSQFKLADTEFIINVIYLKDLNKSVYLYSGYQGQNNLPFEKGNHINISLSYKIKQF